MEVQDVEELESDMLAHPGESVTRLGAYSNASSKALDNMDILELIFSFIDPTAFFVDIWDMMSSTPKDLLLVCLTCRSFFEPATNLLWRKMTSLVSILKIIPNFIKINEIYTISGILTPENLKRFDMYTRKVRFLYLDSFQDSVAAHAIFRLMDTTSMTILPALKMLHVPSLSLDYKTRTVEYFNVLFLASRSQLTTITITCVNSQTEDFLASYLAMVSRGSPSLHELILHGRLTMNSLCYLPTFNQLQFLNLTFQSSVVSVHILKYFSNLTRLTNLTIHLESSSTFDHFGLGRTEGFDALEELRLSGFPTETSKILESIRPPSLRKIIVSSSQSWSQNLSSDSIISCIKECGSIAPANLNLLCLRFGKNRVDILPEKALSSLKDCKQLTYFELAGVSLPITDKDLRDICESQMWSKLQVLILPLSINGNCLSLSSIHTLAIHCPNLVSLRICVDFRLHNYKSLQGERLTPRRPHNLEKLTIVKLPSEARGVGDTNTLMMAIAVSRFVEYYFPNIQASELISDSQADMDWWKGVKAMMAEYKSVRSEEVP